MIGELENLIDFGILSSHHSISEFLTKCKKC